MTLGDLLSRVRIQLAEPNPRRWTDSYLIQLINDAQTSLALRLDFPRQTMNIPVPANTGTGPSKVQVPELVKIWAAYIIDPSGAQVELYGTDIGTLQGDWLQQYDNTSSIDLGAPVQTPQWLTGTPVSPPYMASQIGGWVATKTPWQNTPAQRGAYALQGGYAVILPSYNVEVTLYLDCVPAPPLLVSPMNVSIYPQQFINALKWKATSDALAADNDAQGSAQALQRYEAELAQNSMAVERQQATNPKVFVPLTIRGLRRFGYGNGWWG